MFTCRSARSYKSSSGRSRPARAPKTSTTTRLCLEVLEDRTLLTGPTVSLTSPNGFTFDAVYSGVGAGELVQGTNNAFDELSRLQVGGADYSGPATTSAVQVAGPQLLPSSASFTATTEYQPLPMDTPLTFQSDGVGPVRLSAVVQAYNGNSINRQGYFSFAVDGQTRGLAVNPVIPAGGNIPVPMEVVLTDLSAGSHVVQVWAKTDGMTLIADGGFLSAVRFNIIPNVSPSATVAEKSLPALATFNSNGVFQPIPMDDAPLSFESDGVSSIRFSAIINAINLSFAPENSAAFKFVVDGGQQALGEVDISYPGREKLPVEMEAVLPNLPRGTHTVQVWGATDGSSWQVQDGVLYAMKFNTIPNVGPPVTITGPHQLPAGAPYNASTNYQPIPGDTPLLFQSDSVSPLRLSAVVVAYNPTNSAHPASFIFAVDGQMQADTHVDTVFPGGGSQIPVPMEALLLNLSEGTHTVQIWALSNDHTTLNVGHGYLYAESFNALPTFVNGTRTIVTPTQFISGLNVHREITVPNTGGQDFARTVDVFTNPSTGPITAMVHLVGKVGSGAATTVFATSSGDTLVDGNDQWIGTDDADNTGTPAIIHYIHGPAGSKPTPVKVVGDNIDWSYTITVPAGQTLRLASFTIVSTTRAGAIAAASALVTPDGFGGQAAAFLSEAETDSLANFGLSASAGGPYSINEGSSLTLTAGAVFNPSGYLLSDSSYSWDIDGGGRFNVPGKNPALTPSDLFALGVGTGLHTVKVRVNDGHGHTVDSPPTLLTILHTSQKTWTGGDTDNNWMSPANWGGAAPSPGDDLVFPAGAARLINNNDFSADTRFGLITFTGSGYDIRGNPIELSAGMAASVPGGSVTFQPNLRVVADQTIAVDSGSLSLKGSITGSGSLTKQGTGTLLLFSAAHTGSTTIQDGTVRLGSPTAVANPDGGWLIASGATLDLAGNSAALGSLRGSGSISLGAGLLTVGGNGASTTFSGIISGSGSFIKAGQGSFVLAGANSYTGSTRINAGTLQAGTANVIADTSAVSIAFGAELDLDGNNETVASLEGTGSLDLGSGTLTVAGDTFTTFGGVMRGNGGLTKAGSGRLTLTNNNNSYGGSTAINAGTLILQASNGLGNSNVIVAAGAMLQLQGNLTIASPLSLAGTLRNVDGSSTWNTGVITLLDGATIQVDGTPTLTSTLLLASVLTGTAGFTKTGVGTLTLSNRNHYQGLTTIQSGTLALTVDGALGTTEGGTLVGNGATLSLQGPGGITYTTAEPLFLNRGTLSGNSSSGSTFAGPVMLQASSSISSPTGTLTLTGTINLGANGNVLTFAVGNTVVQERISGEGGLQLSGDSTSTLTLLATCDYSGPTRILVGKFFIQGNSALASSVVTVSQGTTVGGVGTLNTIVVNGGILSPGNSPGTLQSLNGLSLNSQASYVADLAGTSADKYDQVIVQGGAISIQGGSTLEVNLTPGYVPRVGDQFTIIANPKNGRINGTFALLAEGAPVLPMSNGLLIRISYQGGRGGHDVVLKVVDPDAQRAYVTQLYQDVLNRPPDPDGLAYWVARLNQGDKRLAVAQAIWNSREHLTPVVERFYLTYLHRPGDDSGRAYWVTALQHGQNEAQLTVAFVLSAEYRQLHAGADAFIRAVYADLLHRDADAGGLASWRLVYARPGGDADVVSGVYDSGERLGPIVNQDYRAYLRRPGEDAGVAAWKSALQAHQMSEALVAELFLSCDEYFGSAGG